MGTIKLAGSLIMIGLFTMAVLGFAISFASDNNSAVSISDDAEMVSLYSKTKNNVSAFQDDAENTYKSIIDSTVEPGAGTTTSTGPFSVTPVNMVGTVKNILTVGYVKIFGTGGGFGIFLSSLVAFIVFIFGLYAYKTLRGLPD